jgi:hypothetical protein
MDHPALRLTFIRKHTSMINATFMAGVMMNDPCSRAEVCDYLHYNQTNARISVYVAKLWSWSVYFVARQMSDR